MALPAAVPTPPYPDLRRALEALDELVDLVAGLVPVAIDDAADLGLEIDAGELAFTDAPDERSGTPLPGRKKARRIFARLIVERLLADDDIVLYPVPSPSAAYDEENQKSPHYFVRDHLPDHPTSEGDVVPLNRLVSIPRILAHLGGLNDKLRAGGVNVEVTMLYDPTGEFVGFDWHHPARRVADRPQA